MSPDPEDGQNLKYLKIQHGSLMTLGLDIGDTRRRYLIKNLRKFIFNIICEAYMEYGFFNFAAHNITNIDTVTSSLSMFNQGILLTIKVLLIILKGEQLVKLIWDINALAKEANPLEYNKWLSENRRGELIAKSYFYACWTSVVCVATIPLGFMSYGYFKGLGLHLRIPFQVQLPFDDGGLSMSILNYIVSLFECRARLNMSVGIDTLFGWYIHAISGHFQILRLKIKEAAQKIIEDGNHSEFVKEVAAIIKYHNNILKFVENLNSLYGEILWAEITMSCLQICFHLYTLSNDPNFENAPFHFVAFTAIIIQLMIYCFGGEKIKNENNMLCEDIYLNMPWEKMYPSEKKLMLLPLLRAQRETSLMGLYYNINRNLLVFIFKTAFSFITLLGAMKK